MKYCGEIASLWHWTQVQELTLKETETKTSLLIEMLSQEIIIVLRNIWSDKVNLATQALSYGIFKPSGEDNLKN